MELVGIQGDLVHLRKVASEEAALDLQLRPLEVCLASQEGALEAERRLVPQEPLVLHQLEASGPVLHLPTGLPLPSVLLRLVGSEEAASLRKERQASEHRLPLHLEELRGHSEPSQQLVTVPTLEASEQLVPLQVGSAPLVLLDSEEVRPREAYLAQGVLPLEQFRLLHSGVRTLALERLQLPHSVLVLRTPL